MKTEFYTPGHSWNATEFMAQRTLETHGQFFMASLAPGDSVLDCGCGPGTITLGIADYVAPGRVVGVDFAASQIERASADAASRAVENVTFQTADCYSLPFDADCFDRIFSHALMEHLADPVRAMRELHRVLKPGGTIGVCSPDWSGFLISPPSPELSCATEAYMKLQAGNGGDVSVGRRLGVHLAKAGFQSIRMAARYECYASPALIGEYLALQLERQGDAASAGVWRKWCESEGGMFAQAWVSAIARKNS